MTRALPLASVIVMALHLVVTGVAQAPAPDKATRTGSAQTPLPDRDTLIARVRDNIRPDWSLQAQYTYLERQIAFEAGKGGGSVVKRERVFEIYPAADPRLMYRRLVSENGRPVPASELKKRDEKYQQKVRKYVESLGGEGTAAAEQRVRAEARERREDDRRIDDVFRVYKMEVSGRETLEDHPVFVVDFAPVAGIRTASDIGKYLRKFRGRAWVSERDYEVVRVEAEAIESLSIAFGFVARINRGARFAFQRRKVNDEVWLPAEASADLSGRVALIKPLRIDQKITYSDYKKFTADAQIVSFSVPKDEP